jgi:glycosyltransferase involved in cell wall biosynthesis
LQKIRNVKFFGKVPYKELPTKLKEFDIGIIPFKINKLTKAVDPVKVYEYMAAGKNVVSTDLPELYRLKNYIYIAENHEQFIKFCKEAIEKPKVTPEVLIKIAKKEYVGEKGYAYRKRNSQTNMNKNYYYSEENKKSMLGQLPRNFSFYTSFNTQ